MRRCFAATAAVLTMAALPMDARAQQPVTATYGNTTISVGGGAQYLNLPDLNLTAIFTPTGRFVRHRTDGDIDDYGWVTGGEAATRLGFWGPMVVTGGIRGFFSELDVDDTKRCTTTPSAFCTVVIPTLPPPSITPGSFPGVTLKTKTSRDVDYWGGAAEIKIGNPAAPNIVPRLYRNDFFMIGADIRGFDQDNTVDGSVHVPLALPPFLNGPLYHYREQLDTTYTGGYIGLGGEYSLLSYLGLGLQDRLGLRSFITARAGLYSAEVDYDGHFIAQGPGHPPPSRLSLSGDELAFIGSITLETRKQFGPRTSLSLVTDYEYISYAPEMRYNNETAPTRIGDDDAWAIRTALRLNIGFGPSQLYEEPLK